MYKKGTTIIILAMVAVLAAGCGGATTTTPVPAVSEAVETVSVPTEIQTIEVVPPGNSWIHRYGGSQEETISDFQPAEDGGFLMAGGANIQFGPTMQGDVYLLRTDSAGEILWEETYESADYKIAQAISPTNDGGFLVSGVTSTESNGQDIFLTQLDQDRNEIWTKTFGGPLDEFGAAWPLADGGYLVGGCIVDPNDIVADPGAAGYGGFAGRSNILVSRLDSAGNVLWSHTFGGQNNVLASSFLMTQDGGVVILASIARFPIPDDDIYLLKIDANGNEVWSHTWEEGNLVGNNIIDTQDGNYLIVGAYAPSGETNTANNDFLFIKVDPDGNEIWQSIFGDPEMYDGGFAVTQAPSGGYVAMGEWVRDLNTWDADITLVKIDENGQLIWQKIIDINTHTMLNGILPHPDGGYVIAGSTYHENNFDILLIKTDEDGNVQE